MAFFVGEFRTAIDAKHRLAINSALREQIDPEQDGQDLILILGPNRRLWMYPGQYYRKLLATLRRSPMPTRNSDKLTVFFGTARILKPDAQGRIVLPEESIKRSGVGEAVTLIGNDDHIEIWPSDQWDQHVDANMPNYGEMLYDAAEKLNAQAAWTPDGTIRTAGGAQGPPTGQDR